MRLWGKSFGKETKVKDFTGREIAKGAYNDRESRYGWNVDHILPQSRGGKTADHNLVCCHIKTNDEKADSFPCFTANGKRFEIVKVENHYEIHAVGETQEPAEVKADKINFYDSSSGIRFFKELKGIQKKPRFVGTVFIRLKDVANTAVVDFIEKLLDEENISYSWSSSDYEDETTITAKNYNMPMKEDISALLDKCVLLNTYLSGYFVPLDYVKEYDIYCRVDHFREKTTMYIESQEIGFESVHEKFTGGAICDLTEYHDSLFVNDLVCINTRAGDKVEQSSGVYTEYDYVLTNLSENLEKEVKKG